VARTEDLREPVKQRWRHNHGVTGTCTSMCPAYDPEGWKCSRCGRQRAMAADTEDLDEQLCDECFDDAAS
jgi:hypothetical protein